MAFGTSALLYLHRYVFAFVKPTLAQEWHLSNTELGQLDSAFSVCYTAFQFPLAIVADLIGVHLVLTGLILMWCAGMGLMAWAPSLAWMWFSRATLGTGQSAVYACLNRVARMWYPPGVRTTLQGAVGVLAGRLGALSSSLIFLTVLLGWMRLDWRTSVWILTVVGLIQWLVFVIVFRNSPREHPAVNDAEARLIEGTPVEAPLAAASGVPVAVAGRMGVGQMLRSMSLRSCLNLVWLSLQNILSTFADNIYSNWIPLFLAQAHRLDSKEIGILTALPLAGGALGGLIGGSLNDYWIARTRNRRWSRIGVASSGKGMAAVLMFAALLFYDHPYVFGVFLFFVKLFGDWSLSTSLGVVTDIGGKATASVFAFSNSVAGLAMIAAPLVFGYASQHYGWRVVFVVVGLTYALCALSWLVIDCTIPLVKVGSTANDAR